jgi:hypothetical protein
MSLATLEKTEDGKGLVSARECPLHENGDKLNEFTKPLAPELFRKVEKIWRAELMRVEYAPRERMTADGAWYHFYAFANHGSLSGFGMSVGDPKELPALHNLLMIATVLVSYAKSDKNSEGEIVNELKTLIDNQLRMEKKLNKRR